MKKPWQSWKNYAKSLEAKLNEIEERERWFTHYDRTMKRTLNFPDIAACLNYIRAKSKINDKLARTVTFWSEHAMPSEGYSRAEIELMSELEKFKERMESYIETN